MGMVIGKDIPEKAFHLMYQCDCGMTVAFHHEQKVTCAGCGTVFQCRIMVGRPRPVKKVVTP